MCACALCKKSIIQAETYKKWTIAISDVLSLAYVYLLKCMEVKKSVQPIHALNLVELLFIISIKFNVRRTFHPYGSNMYALWLSLVACRFEQRWCRCLSLSPTYGRRKDTQINRNEQSTRIYIPNIFNPTRTEMSHWPSFELHSDHFYMEVSSFCESRKVTHNLDSHSLTNFEFHLISHEHWLTLNGMRKKKHKII